MCELAIMVVDLQGSTDAQTTMLLKRGDVIDVQPDGVSWGDVALSSPRMRMIALPGVSMADAKAFLAREEYVSQADAATGRALKARAVNLNLTGLPAAARTWLADDTRKVPVFRISNFTAAALAALKVTK